MGKLIELFKTIKNRYRSILLMLVDLFLITVCYLTSWLMQLGRIDLQAIMPTMLASWFAFVVIFFIVFQLFGMYQSLWRYAEAYEFYRCFLATMVASVVFTVTTLLVIRVPYFPARVPYSIYFLSALFSGVTTLYFRMVYRIYRTTKVGKKVSLGQKKVMLIGAGSTGNAILSELLKAKDSSYGVVCVVDDDPNKIGRKIQQIKVVGATSEIGALVSKYGIDVIIFAMPHAANKEKKRILNICAKTKCQLRKISDFYTVEMDRQEILSQLHDVSVEDLLGREVIDIKGKFSEFITGKTVLVTGGGGSIGSELCRQIAAQSPRMLIVLDIYENNAYDIQQELTRKYGDELALHIEIASVRDSRKADLIFAKYRPDIVFHAAAHKHVPLMESNPEEAVKNNVFGTWNIARCADRYGVKRFVMISTDKAVNPTNVMGATKRVCEMIVQSMNQISRTDFVAVRFGNVLGSNGSVIPLFKEQIAHGGPVTVTHPDIIRYFMTIPEAVSLVLKAGEMAHGGEIFVLDMGEPVKILDLAENLIRLSGLEPYQDMKIEFSGLRPGEKLFEELLMEEEGLQKTESEKIFVGTPIDVNPAYLFDFLTMLKQIAYSNNTEAVVEKLHELVPTFQAQDGKKGELCLSGLERGRIAPN